MVVVDEGGVQGPSGPPEGEDTTKVASLKMVAEMLQKLNTGSTSFEDMDNTSLKFISEEVCVCVLVCACVCVRTCVCVIFVISSIDEHNVLKYPSLS